MSHDEIVFDELKFREPERRRRPDRDRRWACLAYEVPGPDDLPIFLDRRSADAIERHALRDTSVELGGILLGKECLDDLTGEPFVWITRSLEAKHFENTQASFTYTHDSWEEITRERNRLHPDLDIVGWYHTHPDFGVFLSGHDVFIHRHFFSEPLQTAYVVDPIRQTRGFFRWRAGDLVQVGGFYLTAERGDRIALARLVNDLEQLPNTEGGGGTLSPRLEAELIAMLTRPSAAQPSTSDRVQFAALFGLLGLIAGALGLAAVLWMNTLNDRVQDQALALRDLVKTVEESTGVQRLALDTLLDGAGGGSPDRFTAQYQKTARERDEARRRLEVQVVANDAIAARAREFQVANAGLKAELAAANQTARALKADAEEAPALRRRLAKLVADSVGQARTIEEQAELLNDLGDKGAAGLALRYQRAWYAAAAGWAAALLLGLGLVAAVARRPPSTDLEAEPEPDAPPPHQIS